MPTRQRQRFIYAQALWMLGTIVVLATLGALSLELLFVVSLIGLLIIVELTAPITVTPRWRGRLKWLIAAGILVFGLIVLKRIVEILPPQLLDRLVPGILFGGAIL
ncbi:MAG: hypothetical protein ABEI98_12040 [Halorhabdus sp.]